MIRKLILTFLVTLSSLISIEAQTPSAPAKTQQEKSDDVDRVRITTNLVQVDVTVTDKDGRQVTDLTAEDFEIRETGNLKLISNFSYVNVSGTPSPGPNISNSTPAAKTTRNPPPMRLSADKVRRTIALLVDDHTMTFSSVRAVRDTLEKFVDERAEPGDLIGIFRTGGGNGMTQQFTSDRNQLALALSRLAWSSRNIGATVNLFEPARRDAERSGSIRGEERLEGLRNSGKLSEDLTRMARDRADYFHLDPHEANVIKMLRFLLHDMRTLPGRKAIVLFSDGISLQPDGTMALSRRPETLRILADYANRLGVVIYTVHSLALGNTDYIGADEDPSPDETGTLRNNRARSVFELQNGLNYLAEQTGGTFTRNTNDIGRGLRQALEEQRGYYLIGYRPSEDVFKEGLKDFRKLEIVVKRSGLRLRSRKGFIGISDDVLLLPKRAKTGDSQLYESLASPVAAIDVPIRLTHIIDYDAQANPSLRVLLHIDASQLTFADEADGWKRLTMDVAGVTLGDDGRVVNEFTRTHTVRVGSQMLSLVQQNGLTYTTSIPVKTPGAYQIRMVVRDEVSKKHGSASQLLEISNLKQGRLAITALLLTEASPAGAQGLPPEASIEAALSPVQSPSNAAVRRFQPGASLHYNYQIHNVRLDRATRRPQLTTQVRLFHEGTEVFAGPETPSDSSQQLVGTSLKDYGLLRLSQTAAAGQYVLQINVKDQPAGEKPRIATQWIDFEVVK